MLTTRSTDGTLIAYDKYGNDGPPVILVDGAFCSRTFGPMPKLAPLLAPEFTVYAYDRRARGDSGDTKPYSIDREIDDLQAMLDVAGGSAYVLGMSSGAMLCLNAAAKRLNIKKLAVYEPPYITDKKFQRPPQNHLAPLDALVAAGKKGDAVKYYFTKVIGVPAIVPFIMRLTPMWAKIKQTANALPYDARIVNDFSMPGDQLASITIPVLAIGGDKSPEMLRAAIQAVATVVPGACSAFLPKQNHNVDVKVLAPVLRDFYNG